jgi:hypothetical protein
MVKSNLNSAYYKHVVKRLKKNALLLYTRMSKCSRCQNDFVHLFRSWLPQVVTDNQDKIKQYSEVNKDKMREQRNQYMKLLRINKH